MAMPKILKLFYFTSDFDGVFFQRNPCTKCSKSLPKHFFILFSVFEIKGAKGTQKQNFQVMSFLAHLAKGHVSFCHHFSSVVVVGVGVVGVVGVVVR